MKSNNFDWKLSDGYPASNGLKVFTTFACGGGSSMGYKKAGFEVVAANDIDPEMARVYQKNNKVGEYFLCPIGELIRQDNFSNDRLEKYKGIDILDGSPPCSTFSMAGSREKAFGKNKKFREGQAKQVLSDLFFDWIALLKKLQPKVAIGENVKGMLLGNARAYTHRVLKEIGEAGYDVQLFMLDAATMGVPQTRRRVFFMCRRKDLNLPPINLNFAGETIVYKDIAKLTKSEIGKPLSLAYERWWKATPAGKSLSHAHPKGSFFNTTKVHPNRVIPTITATSGAKITHHTLPYEVSDEILKLAGTFPQDYDFAGVEPKYLIGMSVPPLMIEAIAREVLKQWFPGVPSTP